MNIYTIESVIVGFLCPNNTPNKGILFKYKEECKNANVVWGSNKPIAQKCLPTKLQMSGESCNNIWNNSTKRKTIVNVKYSYPR